MRLLNDLMPLLSHVNNLWMLSLTCLHNLWVIGAGYLLSILLSPAVVVVTFGDHGGISHLLFIWLLLKLVLMILLMHHKALLMRH